MFNKYTEETKVIINLAKKELYKLSSPYLGTEHLVLGYLKSDSYIKDLLNKYNIEYDEFKTSVINLIGIGTNKNKTVLYTPIMREVFERANDISNENKTDITPTVLFMALLEVGDGLASRIMTELNIDTESLYNEFDFKMNNKIKEKQTVIYEIGEELTTKEKVNSFDPVSCRDKEIDEIIQILVRKNKSNPVLLGEAGVGKTAIVEELSRRIFNGNVPNKLKGKHIINLDMSQAVAGTKYRGEFEEKLTKIIDEVSNNSDIILFIDEIHTIVGAGGAEGAIDASNILKPALARNKIKCIGATTLAEYKKFIEKDKALERRFKKVIIEEPKGEDLKKIIYDLKSTYENYHKVKISNDKLDLLMNLTDKYICNHKNPDKTIDILDEVCAHANLRGTREEKYYYNLINKREIIIKNKKSKIKNKDFKSAYYLKQKENILTDKINKLELDLTINNYNKITNEDIKYVLKSKINVPIIELESINRDDIINKIENDVIGQDNNIIKIVDSYLDNLSSNKTYSLLINGKSGVGKTLLAKSIAQVISNNVIHINMSEYIEAHSISKIVGAPPGYVGFDSNNYILEQIKEYPFSSIIFDDIDKCHSNIINLLNQILDKGEIKDSTGTVINMKNCKIIMTCSIDSQSNVGFNKHIEDNLSNCFNQSFINKITEIVSLNNLNKNSINKIINMQLKQEKCLENKEIMSIIKESNYEECGACKIENLINKYKKSKKIYKNYSKN